MRMSGRRTTTSSPGDDVVDDVAVDGRPHLVGPALEVAQEPQQAAGVVALGEALALHQPALGEHGVGVQEPVRGHEVDLRVVGPAGQQRLQDAGERALADGHAAGDADHVRHPRRHRAEERRRHPGQVLGRADVQVEQARQRQVDRRHLVEVDALVDAPQLGEVVLAEGQRGRRAQRRPVVATEREEPAPGLDHTGTLRSPRVRAAIRSLCAPQAARRLPDAATGSSTWSSPTPCRPVSPGAPVRVLDPACGDGRFLVAAARRLLAARRRARSRRHGHRRRVGDGGAPCARRSVGDRVTWRVEHGDALATTGRGERGRRRRRQPAVPLAAGGGDDARRRQPPRRRAVRRRRGRVPRPRRAGRPARQRTHRARAAAVDPRLPRRRSRARRARPPGDDRVVVVVAAAGVRRPGARVRAGRSPLARLAPTAWPHARGAASSPARSDVPPVPSLHVAGTLGQRARLTANFRDQYYGLVPAVVEGGTGPAARHERPHRSRPLRLGSPRRDVRPATVPPPDRRARPPEPADAPLGRRPARAQGARGQPDPGDRGRRRRRTGAGCRASP